MIINTKNKIALITASFIFFNVLYLISAHFNMGNIRLLPIYPFEENLPMASLFIWPYLLMQPFSYAMIKRIEDITLLKRWMFSTISFSIFCFVIFQLFPVTNHPFSTIAMMGGSPSDQILHNLKIVSTTLNSFPSLFVGISFLTSFIIFSQDKFKGVLSFIITVGFCYAGLKIKFLYLSAIVASLVLATLIHQTSKLISKN
jgi:hypothetical protein